MLSAQVLERPVNLEEKRPGTPPGLSALVMRCLEKNRDDRWQTTEEMLPMLEGLATPSGGITPTNTRPLQALPPKKKSRRGLLVGAVAAGLVVVSAAAFLLTRGHGGPAKIDQIAVLPIQDLSGKDQVFVDAMHDALINTLAQADIVGVVPRTDVMKYRDGGQTTRQIAEALHVGALIEGTVFRDGDRVRINMQMVEPATLRHLWAQTYEREVKDVLTAQKDIVEQIAAEVDSALTHPAARK